MKVFKHTRKGWTVLLYNHDNDVINASFLQEEKPKVGDIFQSFTLRDTNFVWTYEIVEILEQRDSKENNLSAEREHLRNNAFLSMKVLRLNKVLGNGIVSSELIKEIDIDSSIVNFIDN